MRNKVTSKSATVMVLDVICIVQNRNAYSWCTLTYWIGKTLRVLNELAHENETFRGLSNGTWLRVSINGSLQTNCEMKTNGC